MGLLWHLACDTWLVTPGSLLPVRCSAQNNMNLTCMPAPPSAARAWTAALGGGLRDRLAMSAGDGGGGDKSAGYLLTPLYSMGWFP